MGYANLKKFFADDSIHTIAGEVALHEGENEHFKITSENTIIISVKTHHHEIPVWANYSSGPGVWQIPDVGAEVMLASDMGNFEGELYVIGQYGVTNKSSAQVPAGLTTQQFNVVVIGDARIQVGAGSVVRLISDTRVDASHDGESGSKLSLHEELHKIWEYLKKQFDPANGHTHKVVVPAQPTNVLDSTDINPLTESITFIEPDGTEILRGE